MKKRTTILTILLIIILISIVSITILYIRKNTTNNNQTNDTKEIYNTWNLYKQEVVKDGKVIYSFNASSLSISFKDNNSLDICYIENEEKNCVSAMYTYDDNNLTIEDNLSTIKGEYIMKLEKDTMTLENTSNNDITKIIFYFKGASG